MPYHEKTRRLNKLTRKKNQILISKRIIRDSNESVKSAFRRKSYHTFSAMTNLIVVQYKLKNKKGLTF